MKKLLLAALLSVGLFKASFFTPPDRTPEALIIGGLMYASGTIAYETYQDWRLFKQKTALQKLHYVFKATLSVASASVAVSFGVAVFYGANSPRSPCED